MTQPPAGPPYTAPGPPPYGPPQEDTTLAVLAHLSLFVFALIGPLVIYLIAKDDPYKPMTRFHAAEALNFHLTLLLASVVSVMLILVVVGIFLLLAVVIAGSVFAIIATIAATKREAYRYPLTIRFVS